MVSFSSLSLFIVLWLYDVYYIEQTQNRNVQEPVVRKEIKHEIPYENKYSEKYNLFTNDFLFLLEDEINELTKFQELLQAFQKQKQLDLIEIERQIELEDEIYKLFSDGEVDNKKELQIKYTELHEKQANIEEIKREVTDYKITGFLNRLKYNHVMEMTPLGNVAMSYNHTRGSFEYYSDHSIPYRYLESVAKKYVMTFHCKSIYVDMQEEIESAKLKKNIMDEQAKQVPAQKKDRFTPLKTYNQNNSHLSKNTNTVSKTQISPLIKENANRYTHNGKFSNFIMLQVVNRKQVDKQYALSYSDYAKKMKQN